MTMIDSNAIEATLKPQRRPIIRCNVVNKTSPRPTHSKSAAVLKLLTRGRGATTLEVTTATGWQQHSVRAYFSGLRKKGLVLVREVRKNGECAYRINVIEVVAPAATTADDSGGVDAARLAEPPSTSVAAA